MRKTKQNLCDAWAKHSITLFVAISLNILVFQAPVKAAPSSPNIILILADDMGIGDIKAINSASKIPTPNLDKMISDGMYFTDAHSNSSVCTPTRYGIVTGRYAWRSSLKKGVLQSKSSHLIDLNRMTVASMLKQKGYNTGVVGKWHLGLDWEDSNDWSKPFTGGPNELGFNYFYGISASLDMDPYAYLLNNKATQNTTSTIAINPWPAFWRGGDVAPDFKMDEVMDSINGHALSFIRNHVDSAPNQPFFLYLPFTGPHTPHIVPPRFKDKSQAGARGDLMYQCDWTVGNVIKLLDSLQISENTVVFFTADNGAHSKTYRQTGHTPHSNLKGQKADIYEAGHRVPLVVKWPGKIEKGVTSDETVVTTDFMATIAAIARYQLPNNAGEDSYSILPVLMNRSYSKPLREASIHHSFDGTFAIRKGDWKLTVDNMGSGGFSNPKVKAGPGTLYNLSNDISEKKDMYSSDSAKVAELRILLKKYKDEGRSTPLNRNDWLLPVGTAKPLAKTNYWKLKRTPSSIQVVLSSNSKYVVQLLTLKGQKIVSLSGEGRVINLSTQNLTMGLHLLQVEINGQTYTKRVLIQGKG